MTTLRATPRPRRAARKPRYPTAMLASALALAATACGPSPSTYVAAPEPTVAPVAPDPPQNRTKEPLVMAVGPAVDTPPPQPPPPPPPPPTPQRSFERIDDTVATRVSLPCPGDCPNSFRLIGPSAVIDFAVHPAASRDARQVLSRLQTQLRQCVRTWKPQQRDVSGVVDISASIGSNGTLGPMDIRSDGDADSQMTTCVASTIKPAKFTPPPANRSISIVVRLGRHPS